MDLEILVRSLFNAASASSILVLIALGLAIIFGMMGVINLAHGELIMLGAYVPYMTTLLGLNIWVGILAAPVLVGLLGMVIEKGIIRPLYGRPLDTLLATWGISIALTQIIRLVFGPEGKSLPHPMPGSIEVFVGTFPLYRIFLMFATAAIVAGVYCLFRFSKFGLKARAVIQNPSMASTLGIDTARMYMCTFGLGAGLAGFAGSLLTPLVNVEPTLGLKWIVRAFLVVVTGGSEIFTGSIGGGVVLGSTESYVSFLSTPYFGHVALLALAIVIIRIRPSGLFGSVGRS